MFLLLVLRTYMIITIKNIVGCKVLQILRLRQSKDGLKDL